MARCLVNKNKEILTIPDLKNNFLPVTVAVVGKQKQKKVATYLYSVTPLAELLPKKGCHVASLLTQCIFMENLDMALDLLRHYPQLAMTPDDDGNTLVTKLATMTSLFRSGCQLLFFQQWIYDCAPNSLFSRFGLDMLQRRALP